MDGDSIRYDNQETIIDDQSQKPRKLPLQYLKDITNNFSHERELGKGGFGVVYKGVLPNGQVMAVKKLIAPLPKFLKQFENEVYHLMELKHSNIVRCVGYCYEIENECIKHQGEYIFAEVAAERLLCLEYLPNGSLDNYLTDESCGLDWHERYNIIKGICYGLHYLHEEWQTNAPIIHMDLKPANILLDNNMVPKIADFGLSRLFGEEQTRTFTTSCSGTFGYMAPEYLFGGEITTKSDIFSLGVIIIETITGHRNYPFNTGISCWDSVGCVPENWRKRLESTSGSSLDKDCQQIENWLQMGQRCTENDPKKRPGIKEIIEKLNKWEKSPTGLIKSNPKDMIVIDPCKLCFRLELNKRIRCLVNLTNNTGKHVGFRFGVKRAANNYSIKPNSGILCPWSKFTVCVTMGERWELPSDLRCNDEFLIQSSVMSEDSPPWSSHAVHKVELPVVYEPPAYPRRLECFPDQKNMDTLIRCISQDLGFSNGRPIAACIIHRCLLQWKSFEAEKTDHFTRIITSMSNAIKEQDNDKLAYWLSNSSTLLLLLQRTFKTTAATRFGPRRRSLFAAIIERIIMENRGFRGTHFIEGMGDLQQVEAKRLALLFKEHLTGFLEKVYGMIRDNLINEISRFTYCCIHEPTISQALIDHWQSVVKVLTNYSSILKSKHVPPLLISKVFTQVFSFINAKLFNGLLLHPECCSFSNGEYVKAGLTKLKHWCISETKVYAGSSWEELRHIRQAVGFLTIRGKPQKTLKEINNLCPVLSIPQLYLISTVYDDTNGTNTVSPEVLKGMERKIIEDLNNVETEDLHSVEMYAETNDLDSANAEHSNNAETEDSNNAEEDSIHAKLSSFLLAVDPTSIPFSVDDILKSAAGFDVRDVDVPPLIRENPCFNFLHQRTG